MTASRRWGARHSAMATPISPPCRWQKSAPAPRCRSAPASIPASTRPGPSASAPFANPWWYRCSVRVRAFQRERLAGRAGPARGVQRLAGGQAGRACRPKPKRCAIWNASHATCATCMTTGQQLCRLPRFLYPPTGYPNAGHIPDRHPVSRRARGRTGASAVNDAGKHAALAGLSRICLVYCDCVRPGAKQTRLPPPSPPAIPTN
jgi:hypothetical protein